MTKAKLPSYKSPNPEHITRRHGFAVLCPKAVFSCKGWLYDLWEVPAISPKRKESVKGVLARKRELVS